MNHDEVRIANADPIRLERFDCQRTATKALLRRALIITCRGPRLMRGRRTTADEFADFLGIDQHNILIFNFEWCAPDAAPAKQLPMFAE